MIEQTDTAIVVTGDVAAPPREVFAVLADPRRHREIDGSGMLRGADPDSPSPVTAVGQVFTMEMSYPSLGEYRTENHVLEFEVDHRITWTTGREGNPPAGVRWSWILDASGTGTTVTHVYDWSQVTDPAVLARVSFPRVPAEKLQQTFDLLAAAVTR